MVITVPAYFGLLEKDATRKAGEIAGLERDRDRARNRSPPRLHYGVTGSADGTTFLVYDLGGGTFDITLIQMTEHVGRGARGRRRPPAGRRGLGREAVRATWWTRPSSRAGDDSLRDDEAMLQDLRTHGRGDQEGPVQGRDQDAHRPLHREPRPRSS